MAVIDKANVLDAIEGKSLELGCGNRKRNSSFVGIDSLDYEDVDIVGDVFEVIASIPNRSIEVIYSEHFLEHIDDVERLMHEMARILRPGGRLEIIVPHFSNPYFYSDLTHKSAFGLYSMSYFCEEGYFKRRVPTYQRELKFTIETVDLRFKSARPFYGRYATKKVWERVFNLSTYNKEFYEENLAYILPCYELRYSLCRNGTD